MVVLHKGAVAYSATTFGANLMNHVFNFYYVKVYLKRFNVDESWFHTAQIIFMLWNAINDPLFGYIQDNFSFDIVKTRRHSILYGAPLFALSFVITWFPWDPSGTMPWVSGMQLLVVLCFYDTLFTFVLLAQCALFTEMSSQPEDRLRLVYYSKGASLLASGAVYFCEITSDHLESFHLFQVATVLIGVVSTMCMVYTGRNAVSPYDSVVPAATETSTETSSQSANLKKLLKQTIQIFKQSNFIAFVLVNFFQIYVNTFFDNFTAIFCDQLIPEEFLAKQGRSMFYGSIFVLPPIALMLAAPIIGKVGYYRVIRIGFIMKAILSALLWMCGPGSVNVVTYILLHRISNCVIFGLFNMCLSDIIDFDKVLYNQERPLSSMVYGMNALVTKPAISIAPMITVSILNHNGYLGVDADSTQQSNPQLDTAMFHLLWFTPLVAAIFQLCIWSFYTFRDTHQNPIQSQQAKTVSN